MFKDGYTPLHSAAKNGSLDVVKFLYENGAKDDLLNDQCVCSFVSCFILLARFVCSATDFLCTMPVRVAITKLYNSYSIMVEVHKYTRCYGLVFHKKPLFENLFC